MPVRLHYEELIAPEVLGDCSQLQNFFLEWIAPAWVYWYKMNTEIPGDITVQTYFGYEFIFDETDFLVQQGILHNSEIHESRVVGVFGYSRLDKLHEKINRSRMRSFLGPTRKKFGDDYDKGHFIANAIGGPIDINLFQQRSDINRGRSAEGKLYRMMEKYIAHHAGTFLFSRPIYTDDTAKPSFLEFGYITMSGEIKYHVFEN